MSFEIGAITTVRAIVPFPEGILLLQRSPNDRHNPGLWEVPGGKLDPDETNDQTHVSRDVLISSLMRELTEETGITQVDGTTPIYKVEKRILLDGPQKGGLFICYACGVFPTNGAALSIDPSLFTGPEAEHTAYKFLPNSLPIDTTDLTPTTQASFKPFLNPLKYY